MQSHSNVSTVAASHITITGHPLEKGICAQDVRRKAMSIVSIHEFPAHTCQLSLFIKELNILLEKYLNVFY